MLEERVRVVVDAGGMTAYEDGAVTGVVYWRAGQIAFPEEGWDDFVVIVLGWWARSLREFAGGQVDETRLDFMDGPFWLRLVREGALVHVECVDWGRGASVVGEFRVSEARLTSAVLTAAEAVLAECRSRGVVSEDLAVLREDCERLRRARR